MKRFMTAILAALILTALPVPVYAENEKQEEKETTPGWKSDTNGWWYDNGDGTFPQSTWKDIDGSRYYFNGRGYMVTGWLEYQNKWYFLSENGPMLTGWLNSGGNRYYLDKDGVMQTGWQKIDGEWYCLDSSTGAMKTGWVSSGGKWYYMSEKGIMRTGWVKDGGFWFYLNEDGVMQTGWQKIDNIWYYLDSSSGAMQTGWITSGGKWYYMSEKGAIQTGWVKDEGIWYYLDKEGVMVFGWQQIDGDWYFFDSKGAMQKGWKNIGERWFYFNGSGKMQTGWYEVGNTWFYFDEDGVMQTGWQQIDGFWFYLSEKGAMQTGWIRDNWYWYYLNNNGVMLTGNQTIDGVVYHLHEKNGYWDEPEGDPAFYRPDSMLIIANKKHKLADGYIPTGLKTPNVLRTGSNPQMKGEAATALENMFAGAKSAGIALVMGSGYRSEATQKTIYDGYVARDGKAEADRFSARPGYSEHQTGLAVDISDATGAHYLSQTFENTAEGKWLFANAYKYGFILRYPKNKESVTGYMYEPWHYRYVGVSTATAIYNSGKTFEEYFGLQGGDYR